MAAGPADAFTATPRSFGCYNRELISDNLWSSSVVATASTGASWVDEVHNSDPVGKRIEDIKRKFHRGRVLQIKHLPREVTEEEIRELLAEWDVQSVTIQSGSARVSLTSSEVLEEWDKNATYAVRGQKVTIVPSPTEMLLCVARLPLSYNESQFNSLVSSYGETRRSFLMISERTGESKGYGFVEYVTKEAALQAKNALDGKRILDCTGVCDWLDSSHITVRSLHSKCLYVDKLPSNYRDMGEFRRVFSTIVNPPYCQIALKNGCPQDWGLVEFTTEDDAEKTQQNLDGYLLHGSHIRVAYYIPGVRAINLYLKLLNDGGSNKGRCALLPDPPAPAVFQQLQSLAKQNPVFAQNLQSIIMQQIQDVQKGKVSQSDQQGKRPPGFQKGNGGMNCTSPFNNSPGNSPPNHNLMKNAQQTALTLLLATQMQQQCGGVGGGGVNGSGQLSPQSSFSLQNQQLLAALQAMTKGHGNGGGGGVGNSGGDPFLNPGMNSGHMNSGNNLQNLIGAAQSGGGMSPHSQMDQSLTNIPHSAFYSPQQTMLSPGGGSNKRQMNDDHWGGVKTSSRSTPIFGSNGMPKTPLLPSPSGLSSPSLEVPMETGLSKSPPGDLQAVWYSLFGQGSGSDSTPTSPGSTSPLFMKSPMVNSHGSSMGRSADALFGMSQYMNKSSPPGFSNGHGNQPQMQQRSAVNGDLQEAINSLLTGSQNFNQMFGGQQSLSGNSDMINSFSNLGQNRFLSQNMGHRQPHFLSLDQQAGGVSNALLDLLMQSMKADQQAASDAPYNMKHNNSWSSSGMSGPPSPIGNNRVFGLGCGAGGGNPPQRTGSSGSSEMSSSSPHSPTYSPFSRNSSKGLLESGNESASPTLSTWSSAMLGSQNFTQGFIGGPTMTPSQMQHSHHQNNSFNSQTRNIWEAPSVNPGATSLNNNSLLNPLGIKRKQINHDAGTDRDILSNTAPLGIHQPIHHPHNMSPHSGSQSDALASHYADTYYKKKKKN